jgi:hypothetical protein
VIAGRRALSSTCPALGSPRVIAFARAAAADATEDLEKVLRLYQAVRDAIVYDPYIDSADPKSYRASSVLAGRAGILYRQGCAAGCHRARSACRRESAMRTCAIISRRSGFTS